jgi:DNA-binding MarR family transcriptional regulator
MSLNRPDSPAIGSVAELLALDRTTLTANLKPLERRGLLKITNDPEDKRSRLLSLTPEGKRLLAKAFPIWKQTHAELDAQLTSSTATDLRTALRELT